MLLQKLHFPIHRTKASYLKPISVCSCGATILIETNKIKLEHYKIRALQKNIVAFTFTFTANSMVRNCRYCCLGIFFEKACNIWMKSWKSKNNSFQKVEIYREKHSCNDRQNKFKKVRVKSVVMWCKTVGWTVYHL